MNVGKKARPSAKKSSRRKTRKVALAKSTPSVGTPKSLPLARLRLDPANPRLPDDVPKDQNALLAYMAEAYEPIEIARSIAAHGYFASEPLIVIKEGASYTVVEGNRRLTALTLLANTSRAAEIGLDDADEWEKIALSAPLPEELPVVVAGSRDEVAPIIGYRHISGIEPWDPWAKARFLANLIDTDGLDFDEAASLVGETEREVRAHYRNYRVERQARKTFKLDTSPVQDSFGVFTRAMQNPQILQFIGAPSTEKTAVGTDPLPSANKSKVRELFSWVFGSENQDPVITDSRKLTELGAVLASGEALAQLRKTRDLEDAFAAAGGLCERLVSRLTHAASSLQAAQTDFHEYADEVKVQDALMRCEELVEELRSQCA
jgi:hypothetical protein